MTVRTITPDSPGWYIPPMPAHNITGQALDAVEPEVQELLDQAAAIDAEAALADAVGDFLQ